MDERLKAIMDRVRGPRVLDVGCTNHCCPTASSDREPWLHGLLVDAGYSVLGVDILDDELEWMREQGYEVARIDAQDLPDLGERFDSIVAGELLEHLENPGRFLAGCRRNLKGGGHLILTTPNPFGLVWQLAYLKHRRSYDRIFNLEHTCWYCAQTVRQLLEREGFAINGIEFVDDLRAGASSPTLYREFARVWGVSRRFLPVRIRSTIVVDASPST